MEKNERIAKIERLMSADRLSEAVGLLTEEIARDADDATLYYLRGRAWWRMDMRKEAITDYERAVALDPGSPARPALELIHGVMDFYNPDLLNP